MDPNEKSAQASTRLCDAIRWHPCLYDSKSKVYQMKHAVEAAWRSIANECEDTVTNCKHRWRIIRKSFEDSVRKYGHGPKNKHYLLDHLEFLVPHIIKTYQQNKSLEEENIQLDEIEDDEQNEEDAGEEEDVEYELEVDEDEVEEIEQDDDEQEVEEDNENDHDQESETSSAEETVEMKKKIGRPRKVGEKEARYIASNQTDDLEKQTRLSRNRKAPKRYIESVERSEDSNQEKPDEKRARRSVEPRKSVAEMMEEYKRRKTLGNLPNKRLEVKLVKPKVTETPLPPEPPKANVIQKARPSLPVQRSEPLIKLSERISVKEAIIKRPAERETLKKNINRATQCDNEIPKTLDEEFLGTIKPQMELMNSRQKFNFKRRVYQALMDVFDDATNFPNKDEVIDLPAGGAPRFDSTTVGELRLMRELVQLVQAAKTTPEFMSDIEKIETPIDISPPPKTARAPPNYASGLLEKAFQIETNVDAKAGSSESSKHDNLGLPRHILQKVVKVAGSNGGTILAHEGEKRRVYRIYPKGTLPPSVQNPATTNSSTIGTFYVTPPKATTAISIPSKTTATNVSTVNGKPIMFNGKVVNTLQPHNMPGPATKGSGYTVMRQKIPVRPSADTPTPKRITATAIGNAKGSPALQNKIITSTNPASQVQKKSQTIVRAVSRPQWEISHPSTSAAAASPSGLSQIQISQPISLADGETDVKPFDLESRRSQSPHSILPDGGDEDLTAAITSDPFDPLFLKNAVKDEPAEVLD